MKAVLVPVLALALSACGGSGITEPRPGVPTDHTAFQGNAAHKPGLSTPFAASSGCSASDCHKSDLRGGQVTYNGVATMTPSCYSCHGQKWSGEVLALASH